MNPHPVGNGTLAPRVRREFAALMAALQLQGANTEALLELTEREWQELLKFCDLAHLTLSLARVEGSGFPAWVLDRLGRNVNDNVTRFERVKATYQEAAAVLNEAKARFLVLKGFTQSPEYVKNPRLRVQSDLDLYCPPEMVERARAALLSIGYRPDERQDYRRADHLPALARPGSWQWRGNAFDPEMPLSIELHFCLWNEEISLFPLPEVNRFWSRREFRKLEDISFPAL
ncbi:MAG TPA: nucleotidyltransferase family protein, partial [Acidobacteriaceae bacterium]|nr:nucleotidyltransferase family protein [Acidobacteriaceae bacterium]